MATKIHRSWLLLAAAPLAGCGGTLSDVRPVAGLSPVGDVALPIRSVEDQRFASVIRQAFDFSCGSAALATLLRFHYGDAQTEETVFRGMWERGDRAQIRRLGFSLLDMKRFLAARGLSGDGFEVTLDQVAEARVPGIALVNIENYRHFVVVKGVANGRVLVGDPSLGLRSVPREDFQRSWNGVYFVIDPASARSRGRFNAAEQWAAYSGAPLGSRFSDPLSQQALALTAPFYGDF
jgi:hypothetical protein